MLNRHKITYWFVLLAVVSSTVAYAQQVPSLNPAHAVTQYPLEHWELEDGLPQNTINDVVQTRDGYLWIATQVGLARFDGLHFETFDAHEEAKATVSVLHETKDGALWAGTRNGGLIRYKDGVFDVFSEADGLAYPEIRALMEDHVGNLWIGTLGGGVNVMRADGTFANYTTADGLPSDNIAAIAEDGTGAIWVGTVRSGLARLDEGTVTTFTEENGLANNAVSVLMADTDGSMWVGSRGGLQHYDSDSFTTYTTEEGLTNNHIGALHRDRSGSLWIGTRGGGLVRYQDGTFTARTKAHDLADNDVISLWEDREGSLWIGTGSLGLHRIWNGKFINYTVNEGLPAAHVYTIYEHTDGAQWFGTDGGAVRMHAGETEVFTAENGLPSDDVYAIEGTPGGSVWVGTAGGLVQYEDGNLTTYTSANGLGGDMVFSLYTDDTGRLWIATDVGVTWYDGATFGYLTPEDGLATPYIASFRQQGETLWIGTYNAGIQAWRDGAFAEHYTMDEGLTGSFVMDMHVDSDDPEALWLSVREGGLQRLRNGELTTINTKSGLYSNTVQRILEDTDGNFWMSSNIGLFRVHKDDLNAVANGEAAHVESYGYTHADGLISREFNGGTQPAGWVSLDGTMMFPSTKGVVTFDPTAIPINTQAPLMAMQMMSVQNTPVTIIEGLRLPPGQRQFEFDYVGLSFIAPDQVKYRYRLEGEDDAWVEAGPRRAAFYNTLAPGAYTFHVQAANSDGVWSTETASVSFYLEPFFYQTRWFWILVMLTVLAMALTGYKLRVRSLKARQRELEQTVAERTRDLREEKERTEQALVAEEAARREAERQRQIVEEAKAVIEEQADQLREMDRIKMRFFSNISHEFRTPLTLNIGPLENALTGVYGPVSDAMRGQLQVMLRNARRLLRLINQLLDLSKLESGRMRLNAREDNIVDLVEGVVLSFTAFADNENIGLHFKTDQPSIPLYFDPRNLEKVFFNLLSNAVKFTPSGGEIFVDVAGAEVEIEGTWHDAVAIQVRDTGQGIPTDQLPYIFDRFRQVDGTVSRVQEGTGIGLSLVKELVTLHGGQIHVESTPGEGTTFTVTLLTGTDHFDPDQIISADLVEEAPSMGAMVEMSVFNGHDLATQGVPAMPTVPVAEQMPKILIVDDNPDIRQYVTSCLHLFDLVTAVDGQDGLEKARAELPDLIISDVMMPRMNGYEFCRAVKSDDALNHIPVIMLTSKASTEARIEGLEAGADDYLAKPFNARELLARVGNLLDIRSQQRELKELNEELSDTNQALREANELKSQLLGIASHDMKNPLMAIREFARIIKSEIPADSHLVELLDLIYTTTNQMLNLVMRLLDSAALESGKIELDLTPTHVNELAEEVVYRNSKRAELKQQTLNVIIEPGVKLVSEIDREHIYDAMENLVSNAVKYSPHDRSIYVSVRRKGDEVIFAVQDNGPGISVEDQAKLFGKFQKLSAQPTGGETSTGLGLSIVKQIVELHGGRVWADSVLGEGSTFSMALPAMPTFQGFGDRAPQPPTNTRTGSPQATHLPGHPTS